MFLETVMDIYKIRNIRDDEESELFRNIRFFKNEMNETKKLETG